MKNVLSGLAWSVRQKIRQDALDTEGSFREVPPAEEGAIESFLRQPFSRNPANNRWVKDIRLDADTGTIVTRGIDGVSQGRGIRLVIDKVRNAAGQEWTIVTAYPIP